MDVTSSRGCKGETYVLVELHDWSRLTVQPQLEETCGPSSACLLENRKEKHPQVHHKLFKRGKDSKQLWQKCHLVCHKEETHTLL